MFRSVRFALLASVAFAGMASGAQAATLHILGTDNMLARIDTDTRQLGGVTTVRGMDGKLLAVAVRPADGKLYGLTDAGQVVMIDPQSGQATQVSRLSEKLETGARLAINFNPVVDRLRVVGINGANYRIHVDTGAVTKDGMLRYADGTSQAGKQPMVTAAAYTNHWAGTKETGLYTIDPGLGQINLQAPPNDGVQQPKVNAGAPLPQGIGFDILADGQGGNTGYIVAGGKLHILNMADAKLTLAGPITGLTWSEVLSIAVVK